MTYPERGASYEHNPKFIDRMKAAERAEGGADFSNGYCRSAADA